MCKVQDLVSTEKN